MRKAPESQSTKRNLSCAGLMTVLLASCGGGSDLQLTQDANQPTQPSYLKSSSFRNGSKDRTTTTTTTSSSTGTSTTDSSTTTSSATSPSTTSVSTSSVITSIKVENSGTTAQSNIPLTFGQPFAQGAVFPTDSLSGRLSDGTVIPLQIDVKATHPDGSIRHGIISAVSPSLALSQNQTVELIKGSAGTTTKTGATPADLINSGFTASVNLNLGGQIYTASADALLKSGKYTSWLSGPIVNEWLVSAPLTTAQGTAHPHLTARFAIRSYTGLNKARVDVTIENDWAYEPAPQNFTYDAQVLVGGQVAYSKSALTHFHHARWHKTFWWGAVPQVHIRHDTNYLIATKALPSYDTSIVVSSTGLSNLENKWNSSYTGPMDPGIVLAAMPTAGGRPDIGPLPQWAAMYLLSMDSRAKKVTLGVGDLAGSWPIHYRDKNTDQPVSLVDYPYMSLLGGYGDSYNPVTGKNESFPSCGGICTTTPYNYNPDSAHQPSMAYVPYLVTGDYYYLEELEFWANWNMFRSNPYYRNFAKGVVKWDEVRGQAWSLRTLAQTAYITPDNHPMKRYFTDRTNDNLDWYNATYVQGNPNQLGVIDGSGDKAFKAILYTTPAGAQTGIAPWQDDFFTWSAGYATELGYTKAQPLLQWKAKFPIARITAAGYCWIDGAPYTLSVRPGSTAALYSTFNEAYLSTMRKSDGTPLANSTGAKYLDQPCNTQAQADWRTQYDIDNGVRRSPWAIGEMTGYATSTQGYPSNMQPALAVAATSGVPNGQTAWNTFIARPVKPNYSSEPQWAVVPRK